MKIEPNSGANHEHSSLLQQAIAVFFLTIGALLVAFSLQSLMIPKNIIDGGVVGIAIMGSYLSQVPFGIWIVVLNLPFMWMGYQLIGKTFAVRTLYAVIMLAIFSEWQLVQRVEAVQSIEPILAAIFGGMILGVGVGLIIRFGGALDGTEIIAIISTKRLGFSVGEIVMFFNVFILGSAGFVFDWRSAMYSLVAFYVAFKMIDIVLEGLEESKSVTIISDYPGPISEAIIARLGRGVTHIYGKGGYTLKDREILYCIISRLEVAKLKSIVMEHDPQAIIAVEHVYDLMSGDRTKKKIH